MKKITLILTLIFNFYSLSVLAQNYIIDSSFNSGTGFNLSATVYCLAQQTDGKIICGGTSFSDYNGTILTNNLIRLNSDGTFESQFESLGSYNTIVKIIIQNDGKILVAAKSSGSPSKIFKYNSDGTIDNTFFMTPANNIYTSNTNTSGNGNIDDIQINSLNEIYVIGGFNNFNGTGVRNLIKLNSDGSYNSQITEGSPIYGFKVLNDNKILVSVNTSGSINLKRYNSNWTNDSTYSNLTGTQAAIPTFISASPFYILNNGKVLFSKQNSNFEPIINRLNINGGLDSSFNLITHTGFSGAIISHIIELDNNKILTAQTQNPNSLRIYNENGTVGNTNYFNVGFNGTVYELLKQSDNKILVSGRFTNYNGTTTNSITRLIDGTLSSDEYQTSTISIFPNPVKDVLFLENSENVEYQIYDMTGKNILKGINNHINITSLEKGIYIIKIVKEDKIITEKFIKE